MLQESKLCRESDVFMVNMTAEQGQMKNRRDDAEKRR